MIANLGQGIPAHISDVAFLSVGLTVSNGATRDDIFEAFSKAILQLMTPTHGDFSIQNVEQMEEKFFEGMNNMVEETINKGYQPDADKFFRFIPQARCIATYNIPPRA